jgi:hypothetical protein
MLQLKESAKKLIDVDDELKWSKNKGTSVYTTKLEYATKTEEEEVGENMVAEKRMKS